MSTHASPGSTVTVFLVAAILGFGGGAFAGSIGGNQQGAATGLPSASATSASPTETTAPSSISLTAAQTSVRANDQIDMAGRLEPAVAGVELTVERSLNGSDWDTFPDADDPVTVTTADDGSFSTYVRTGRAGENQFRVVGLVGEQFLESEPVTVTIG